MDAILTGAPLRTSVADNIGTLTMVEAPYKSRGSNVFVDL